MSIRGYRSVKYASITAVTAGMGIDFRVRRGNLRGSEHMPRVSNKENKSVYQLKREELDLSREQAAELLEFISEDRLYRIEHDDLKPHPDEVLLMAEKYKDPSLCNHYCAKYCQIGSQKSFEVEIKDLPTIVLQTVASLNALDKHKERFIEIASDCRIDETEINDFHDIQEVLKKVSIAVEALRLWAEQMEGEAGELAEKPRA